MNPTSALGWDPPSHWHRLVVIESHTGGEPFRVVIEGLPEIPGETVLDRRRHAQSELDHLRKAMMWEPRGHADMYGGWPGSPTSPDSDISVLFVHNEGFSTMCGHGIIALSKVALETGILPASQPETVLGIDTPAGRVVATSTVEDGRVTATRFRNVASFAVDIDATVSTESFGRITYDLAFGGAFYAIVDVAEVGLSLNDVAGLIGAGRSLKEAIAGSRSLEHPDHPDMGFLYGVIFTSRVDERDIHSRNVCVFADGEVDRSPTGTGMSARLAVLVERGELPVGESITVESLVGSRFTGRAVKTARVGAHDGIVPEIEGSAHLIGRSELWIDPEDPLGRGFLVR